MFGRSIQCSRLWQSYMRRATARIAQEDFGSAIQDLIAALDFEPNNKECARKLDSIIEHTATAFEPESEETTPALHQQWRQAWMRAAIVRSVRAGWVSREVKGNPSPGALNGHALFQALDNRVYLFGGRSVRDQKAQLFVMDDQYGSWGVASVQGTAPRSRAWHTVSHFDDRDSIYCVYGGVSSHGEDPSVYLLAGDVVEPESSMMHTLKWRWIEPSYEDTSEKPLARSGHAAVGVPSSLNDNNATILVFGGRTKRGVCNDLNALTMSAQDDHYTVAWKSFATESCQRPAPRDGHSMCFFLSSSAKRPCLIVFGGNGQQSSDKLGDTWVFDLVDRTWTELDCDGNVPSPRSYHSAHMIGPYLLIIGGRTADAEDSNVFVLDTGAFCIIALSLSATLTIECARVLLQLLAVGSTFQFRKNTRCHPARGTQAF